MGAGEVVVLINDSDLLCFLEVHVSCADFEQLSHQTTKGKLPTIDARTNKASVGVGVGYRAIEAGYERGGQYVAAMCSNRSLGRVLGQVLCARKTKGLAVLRLSLDCRGLFLISCGENNVVRAGVDF